MDLFIVKYCDLFTVKVEVIDLNVMWPVYSTIFNLMDCL